MGPCARIEKETTVEVEEDTDDDMMIAKHAKK